ncbi:MAG TPA: enoyl-CoA hydratase-related protein [Thermomicrobiales bacterium]
MEQTILIERTGAIAILTLNRPASRNALSRQLAADLLAALTDLAREEHLRALILTGAGDRAFCAGADLVERRTMTPAELTAHTASINAVCDALADFPAPTIAAVRGFALAGGAELAVACDLRVAAEDAVFGYPEVKIGVFPGAGGVVRLPQLVGAGAARDLLYTGRNVYGDEALRIGLVDRLVPSDRFLRTARDLAEEIAANAPLAVRAVKRALVESIGLAGPDARRAVARHRRPLDATADYAEGLAAFSERRRPEFEGR